MELEPIRIALHKSYEERTDKQHRLICAALGNSFQTHSDEKIKMMSFFI